MINFPNKTWQVNFGITGFHHLQIFPFQHPFPFVIKINVIVFHLSTCLNINRYPVLIGGSVAVVTSCSNTVLSN